MSYDLTGAALPSYMLKVIRDIVSRSPRFRASLGDVAPVSSNMVSWGDAQVIIKDVSADGVRLSPNYFVSTMLGRAIVAKLQDFEGAFVEWANEVDASGELLDPGVYYMGIESVNEATKDVNLILQKFKWRQGSVTNAEGTKIVFRTGIDATTVVPSSPNLSGPVLFQSGGSFIYLLSSISSLVVHDDSGNLLTPNTDYWVESTVTTVLLESTQFGFQDFSIPSAYLSFAIVNQNDFQFRPGVDYTLTSATTGRLAAWTAAGQTISAVGVQKLDPTVPANLINPENVLNFTLEPDETLVTGQVFISTQDEDHIQVTPNIDGTVTLPQCLPPGGYCRYEVRIETPRVKVTAKKNSINPNIIPGLWVAIGDRTLQGDQISVIVSPHRTQTYEVYGSKDNVRFTIDVKANDPATASEIAELIKDTVLIFRRVGMESDGLAIFEMARSDLHSQRDNSGTAPSFTYSLNVTGAADWRVFVPLITRITSFDITATPYTAEFSSRVTGTPRYNTLGYGGFIPEYR